MHLTWLIRHSVAIAALFILLDDARGQRGGDPLSGSNAITPTGTNLEDDEQSGGWGWIPLPKITLPKLSMPKIEMPKSTGEAFAPIKNSAKKVSGGAKKAWEGTKELFSFARFGSGSNANERTASKPKQSVWDRLVSRPAESDAPGTIGEFINSPRPR